MSKAFSKDANATAVAHKMFAFDQLPMEVINRVLTYLSYDELSRCRAVSKSFDAYCRQLLNTGFTKAERFHAKILFNIKAKLPRRESERRSHELSRHVDILTAIETRLSLLSMTFRKYIDTNCCCFIPGKVVDELFRILRLVGSMPKGDDAPRSHEVLRELRDISSMAMEYFDENLVPYFKNVPSSSFVSVRPGSPLPSSSWFLTSANTSAADDASRWSSADSSATSFNDSLLVVKAKKAIREFDKKSFKILQRQIQTQRSEMCVYKKELANLSASFKRQRQKNVVQSKAIVDQGRRLDEMNRKLMEHDSRFTELTAELRASGAEATKSGFVEAKVNDDGASLHQKATRKRGASELDEAPKPKTPKTSKDETGRYALRSAKKTV